MQKLVALTPSGQSPSSVPPRSHHPSKHKLFAQARELEEELRAVIKGEIRFSDGDRALYASDVASYREVPTGVVLTRAAEDAIATLRLCSSAGAPVLSRGGGVEWAITVAETDFAFYDGSQFLFEFARLGKQLVLG